MNEPSKAAPARNKAKRSPWILVVAYSALALVFVFGVMRVREKRQQDELKKPVQWNLFVPEAIPEPLHPSPLARRMVRWCEALDVLQRKCQRCHTTPPVNGAPIALLKYSDTQADYPAGSGLKVYTRMSYAIRHRTMPRVDYVTDPPVEPLEPAEVDTLLVWLEEGAMPFGGEDCASANTSARGPGATDGPPARADLTPKAASL